MVDRAGEGGGDKMVDRAGEGGGDKMVDRAGEGGGDNMVDRAGEGGDKMVDRTGEGGVSDLKNTFRARALHPEQYVFRCAMVQNLDRNYKERLLAHSFSQGLLPSIFAYL